MKFCSGILLVLLLNAATRRVYADEDTEDSSDDRDVAESAPASTLNCWDYCEYTHPYYDPICVSDQQTYYNICYLRCENEYREQVGLKPLWMKYEFACIYVPCNCPNTYSPVCDEYGSSHYNFCYLDCASRQSRVNGYGSIAYQHGGLCIGDPCACPYVVKPLCAYDGKKYETFGNPCLLRCENARRQNQNLPLMKEQYPGECKTPVKKCTDECKSSPPFPVCGTNNVTYLNVCYLNCASLEAIQNGQKPIFIAKIGPC
uniref:Inhibitor serine protease 1 n=1 Tax=Tineola bisselliella TaxID=93883 RepID=A0A891XGY1_TINBI|nr:inhibitor serine protease 1 [Tineola bisselliella]